MGSKPIRTTALEAFRSEWARWHLDYQRAAEVLDSARHVAKIARAAGSLDALRSAEENIEAAEIRLAQVHAMLTRQFDRFCGLTK
ncbi:MAG: hypothetical protein ABSC94_00860 [Polyangiaceae bacterium]|jgi:uncharacterized protein YukE